MLAPNHFEKFTQKLNGNTILAVFASFELHCTGYGYDVESCERERISLCVLFVRLCVCFFFSFVTDHIIDATQSNQLQRKKKRVKPRPKWTKSKHNGSIYMPTKKTIETRERRKKKNQQAAEYEEE